MAREIKGLQLERLRVPAVREFLPSQCPQAPAAMMMTFIGGEDKE